MTVVTGMEYYRIEVSYVVSRTGLNDADLALVKLVPKKGEERKEWC